MCGAHLYPRGGCRVVLIWCYVCSVCFIFVFFAFAEDAFLRSIVLRSSICMRSESHAVTTVCVRFILFFSFLWGYCFFRVFLYHYLYRFLFVMESVCVCVFFPFILDIKFVGHTSRGHTGGRSHRIFHPPSFCGACLNFSREKDSAIPFPRRP